MVEKCNIISFPSIILLLKKKVSVRAKNVGNSGFQHKAVDQGGVTTTFYREGDGTILTIGAQYLS